MKKTHANVTFNPLMKRALIRDHKKVTKDLRFKTKGPVSERASGSINDANEAMGRTLAYMTAFSAAGFKTNSNQMWSSGGAEETGPKALDKTWPVFACNAPRPVRESFAFDEVGIHKKNSQNEYRLLYPWENVTVRQSRKYLFFYTSTDYALVIPRSAFDENGDDVLCVSLWEKKQIKKH